MDLMRRMMTAVARVEGERAPINQFVHTRAFTHAAAIGTIGPNADMLQSTAWVDLTREPMILSVPSISRYYTFSMIDAWTNVFAAPGSRTTGTNAMNVAIVGPGWRGTLPSSLTSIAAPTNLVCIVGRTQTDGVHDYAAVHEIQDALSLTPLTAWIDRRKATTATLIAPDVDMATPAPEQIGQMDAVTFFSRLNALMAKNPPAAADASALDRYAAIAVAPGQPFRIHWLSPKIARGVTASVSDARSALLAKSKAPFGRVMNGWHTTSDLGNYGTNYLWRAVVARVRLGAPLPADTLCLRTVVDNRGHPLNGGRRYVMRFPNGHLPPVNAFWSMTIGSTRHGLVPNTIDRYAIGDRDHLVFGRDGALTLCIQRESPGPEYEPNWLPAPPDEFALHLRLYSPKAEAIEYAWKAPLVERAF
jgi:hypothetical protein